MQYGNITSGVFCARPNRFIARCEINGQLETCHVKNTGRCKELLIPGVTVYLDIPNNPHRKTKYDLIAVQKGGRLINMDSQSPNKAFFEWAKDGGIPNLTLIKPEQTYGHSRFDFYMEAGERRIYCEVKGVTLEENGVVRFPDAPTQRGVKHINELILCKQAGYEAMLVFVIQMQGVEYFTPNRETHKEFTDALKKAYDSGVEILAMDCEVTPESMKLKAPVNIVL